MDLLDALRQKLKLAQNALLKQSNLLLERDALHSKIDELTHELESDFYKEPEEINSKQKQVALLKQQMIGLDHALDEIESILQIDEETLKENLAMELLSRHPDEKLFYDNIKSQITTCKIQTSKIERWIQLCQQLIQLLETTQSVRQTIRRRGILSYIFGGNPTVIISQHLQAAELLIAKAEPELVTSEDTFKPTLREFSLFLKGLRKECGERWGFNKIDTTMGQAVQILNQFRIKYESMLTDSKKKFSETEEQFLRWLLLT